LGLSAATARTVATELTSHGALAAHLDAELHIDPADIPSPVQAAAASALSFTTGALLPLLAILLPRPRHGYRSLLPPSSSLSVWPVPSAPASVAATSAAPSCG
jgi:hypothetical protein